MLTSDRRRSDGSLQRGAPTAMNAIMALLNLRTVYPIYDVRDGDYPIDRTGRFLNTQYEHMCNINPDECNLVIRDARGNEIGRRDEWNFTKEIGDGGLGVSEYLRQQVANADRNIGNRPLIYIRFNPDAYINEHGNKILSSFKYHKTLDVPIVAVEKEWNHRLNILKKTINKWLNLIPEKEITNEYLFYDKI